MKASRTIIEGPVYKFDRQAFPRRTRKEPQRWGEDDTDTGDIKIKGDDWKEKIRSATSFDDIFRGFLSAGMRLYGFPREPEEAAKLFDTAKWLEPLMAEFKAADTAVRKLEVSDVIRKRMRDEGANASAHMMALVPGYSNLGNRAEMSEAAGKEIFESVKAKGAAIVDSWKSDGSYTFNRGRRAHCINALTELSARQETAEKEFYFEKNEAEKKTGFQQAITDSLAEGDNASAVVTKILMEMQSIQPSTPEWIDARTRLDAAREDVETAYVKWKKVLHEKQEQLYETDEYKAAVEKFTDPIK